MPRSWSDKDERQYEHVLASEEKRDPARAKEIAARTVNKQRNREGRTEEQARSESERTREELYAEAKRLGVHGRSRMNKSQLEAAVNQAR